MTDDLTGRLRDAHPLQYGWLAASPREMVMHTETVPDGIVDRMNRCPVCEQWSPCDVRGALDRITELETENKGLGDDLALIRRAHDRELVIAAIDRECGESYLRDPSSDGYCNYWEVTGTVLEFVEDVFQRLAAAPTPTIGADNE